MWTTKSWQPQQLKTRPGTYTVIRKLNWFQAHQLFASSSLDPFSKSQNSFSMPLWFCDISLYFLRFLFMFINILRAIRISWKNYFNGQLGQGQCLVDSGMCELNDTSVVYSIVTVASFAFQCFNSCINNLLKLRMSKESAQYLV